MTRAYLTDDDADDDDMDDDDGDGGFGSDDDIESAPADVGGMTSGASVPQPAAPSGADSAAGSSTADVREAAPESAQTMDGYAADGEAIATDDEASGQPSAPRRDRRAKQKGRAVRRRQAKWRAREAEHAAVLEDVRRLQTDE